MTAGRFSRRLPAACAAVVAATLAGCGGLLTSDRPPEQTWWLEPAAIPSRVEDTNASLAIVVTAVPGLATDHWLALEADGQLRRYAAAVWPAQTPEYVASLLQQSFADSRRWQRVLLPPHAHSADARLDLRLQRFFVDRERKAVSVKLSGRIECGGATERIDFETQADVSGDDLGTVANAFQRAIDDLTASVAASATASGCAG